MCPYSSTSSFQAFRNIVEATTDLDVLNENFSKLEHGKIQLVKCKDTILLFGFYGIQITIRNFSRKRECFLTGNNANMKILFYRKCGSVV